MSMIQVTEENLDDYRDLIPEDIAENLSRQPYHCIALEGEGEGIPAALVWEFMHLNDVTKPTLSRLSWLYARDRESGNDAFSEYGAIMGEVEAKKSLVLMPEKEAEEVVTNILTDAGFELRRQEGLDLLVTVGMLSELNIVRKTKLPEYLHSIGSLPSRSFRRGLMNCIFHTVREKLEDLSALPMEWFDPDVSCYVETDDMVTGLLLVHRCPSGRLRIEFMSATGPDGRTDLMYMVRYAILEAVKNYPEDTQVILPRRDESSRKLAAYFFPDQKGEKSIFGSRTENRE